MELPVLRHACGMVVGPCTMAVPCTAAQSSLMHDSGAWACSGPLPAQEPLAEVIFWSLKTVTRQRPLTQAHAVMVTRVRDKLASVT